MSDGRNLHVRGSVGVATKRLRRLRTRNNQEELLMQPYSPSFAGSDVALLTAGARLSECTSTHYHSRKPSVAVRRALLCAALASVASAQNQAWIRQFGTVARDVARSAASDGSGGLYVCGQTEGSLGGPSAGSSDAWIARYDNAGNRAWIHQFGSSGVDSAHVVTPDGGGGAFASGWIVNGQGDDDAWLAHYDGSGNRTWIQVFGTGVNDRAYAAVTDGAGGVYVSGYTVGTLGGTHAGDKDFWLARYDGAGNRTWIRQFGTSAEDVASAAASDGSGGVYLTGYTLGSFSGQNSGVEDIWVAHYDGLGDRTWIRQFGTSVQELVDAAAPDGSGGVYVSGFTDGDLGGPNGGISNGRTGDAWIARYDSAGNRTWILQLGYADNDRAQALAPDGIGGLFVSGHTWGSLGGPNAGDPDAWLARYDSAGIRTWIQQLGTSVDDGALALATVPTGGVYASGWTRGSLGGSNAGDYDVWLGRFDALASVRYCAPAILNSTGQFGTLFAIGSNQVAANDITLGATNLPHHSFGFFNTSRDQGSTYPAGGGQGRLCLGGSIGRYVGPGQVKNSGSTGSFTLVIDLTAMPHPLSSVVVQPGQTWYFQAWYRDANPTSTSNLTDAVSVTFS